MSTPAPSFGSNSAPDGTLSDEERIIVETFRREQWPGVIKLGAERLAK